MWDKGKSAGAQAAIAVPGMVMGAFAATGAGPRNGRRRRKNRRNGVGL